MTAESPPPRRRSRSLRAGLIAIPGSIVLLVVWLVLLGSVRTLFDNPALTMLVLLVVAAGFFGGLAALVVGLVRRVRAR